MLLWIVFAVLALAILWRRRRPAPFPAFLTPMLESSIRRRLLPPAAVVQRLGLEPAMRVLEIGTGGGLFTEAIVRAGSAIRLVCLDVQPAMLRQVRQRLGADAPELVCATASVLPFAGGSFDRILMVSVLGEVPDRDGALRECARVLGEHGLLVITEALPDPDFIAPGALVREATRAGLVPLDRSGWWPSYTQRFARRATPRC